MRAFFIRKRIFGPKILYESALRSFVIFGAKILYEKCARKMLMKLTTANVSQVKNGLGLDQFYLNTLKIQSLIHIIHYNFPKLILFKHKHFYFNKS
jgi:hypothetical protein